jgi:anti-sigma regulatory factor (Ser/Thr protein kinase)
MDASPPVGGRRPAGASPHAALVYDGREQFATDVGRYVRDGLVAGQPVAVALPPDRAAWLREELAGAAGEVDFLDRDALYRRPGAMFARMGRHLADAARRGAGGRLVGESGVGTLTDAQRHAHMRYESVANVHLTPLGGAMLCLYDAAGTPPETLDHVRSTHPHLWQDGREVRCAGFREPAAYVPGAVPPRPGPSGGGVGLSDLAELADARAYVAARAQAHGITGEDLDDLVLAANEVGANALRHGRPPRTVQTFTDDGHFCCRVRDGGPGMRAVFAGYAPPSAEQDSGRGLWLANQLCDIVEIRTGADGTEVTLLQRLPG